MLTVLLDEEAPPPGGRVRLAEQELHHLRVRRAGEPAEVRFATGRGVVGWGRVLRAGGGAELEVERLERVPPPVPLALAVGAGDRDRFGWLAEKAAELGVTDLIPLETERTRGVASRVREGDRPRLARRALEAIKQCGSAWAPVVHELTSLAELAARPLDGARWLADPEGALPPAVLDRAPLLAVVGPEGGLTPGERDLLLSSGYLPVGLGAHILRFETAAVAAAVSATTARQRGTHG